MITELLELLETSPRAFSFEELAEKLNIEPSMVGAILENLEHQNIVRRTCMQNTCSKTECTRCIGCNPNSPGLFAWELIEQTKPYES